MFFFFFKQTHHPQNRNSSDVRAHGVISNTVDNEEILIWLMSLLLGFSKNRWHIFIILDHHLFLMWACDTYSCGSVGSRGQTRLLEGLISGLLAPCSAFISKASTAHRLRKRIFVLQLDIYTKAEPMQIRNSRSANKHFLSNPDNEMEKSLLSQNLFVITLLLTFQRK